MKFIDKYDQEHKGRNKNYYFSIGCPYKYGYEDREDSNNFCTGHSCKECWNREIPEKEEKKMELKVGDFVKTRYGIVEILHKGKNDCTVGIKGFDGHNASTTLSKEFVEKKGYLYQCWYFNDDNLEKVEDPSLLINEEFDEPKEMVNHPSHYNQGKREVIEEMRILFGDEAVESFCRLNAYKYLRRAEFKGNKKEDLDKAEWYMDYLEMMRGEE